MSCGSGFSGCGGCGGCGSCGNGRNQNINNCNSPCQVTTANTAACETLPSQIQNFTTQFFGIVTKSEIDGQVVWNLPCNLEVGLENNPRESGEGLACYFLRLFSEGIVGATGPKGDSGADGSNGYNAFTVLLASFTQPTLAAPSVQITVYSVPGIVEGLYLFIQDAGWYQVNATDGLGTLWLTLTKQVASDGATVPAGKLVIPSGYPGASITGPVGQPGPIGPVGPAGSSWTETNSQVSYFGGTDYSIQDTIATVNFGAGLMQILLPDAGTYLVTAQVSLKGLTGVATSDVVTVKLKNITDVSDLDGGTQLTSRIAEDEYRLVTVSVITAIGGPNRTVSIKAVCTTSDKVQVNAANTTLSYVRIA